MNKASYTSVLVVDEHPVVRWGLCHFLETQRNIKVIGEASTLSEALESMQRLKPDVAIMDLQLTDGDPMEATSRIAAEGRTQVLAFSARDTWDFVEKFMNAGGAGFVTKRCSPDELISAVLAVAAKRQWISPSLRKVASTQDKRSSKEIVLSPREREVAALVARGFTSRQIADQLCVSLKTVETHRYRMFKELNIRNRAELVNYVIEHDLMRTSDGSRTISTRSMEMPGKK